MGFVCVRACACVCLCVSQVNPILRFLSYFWAPMPIMIWVAALVELIKASSTGEGWPDFVVLLILQFANGMVSGWALWMRMRAPGSGKGGAVPTACLEAV